MVFHSEGITPSGYAAVRGVVKANMGLHSKDTRCLRFQHRDKIAPI